MELSPLAHLLLQHHRARPGHAMYDLAAFGMSYSEAKYNLDASDLERLDAAYKELEDGGLLERTDQVGQFRKHFFYYYRYADGAVVGAGACP